MIGTGAQLSPTSIEQINAFLSYVDSCNSHEIHEIQSTLQHVLTFEQQFLQPAASSDAHSNSTPLLQDWSHTQFPRSHLRYTLQFLNAPSLWNFILPNPLLKRRLQRHLERIREDDKVTLQKRCNLFGCMSTAFVPAAVALAY